MLFPHQRKQQQNASKPSTSTRSGPGNHFTSEHFSWLSRKYMKNVSSQFESLSFPGNRPSDPAPTHVVVPRSAPIEPAAIPVGIRCQIGLASRSRCFQSHRWKKKSNTTGDISPLLECGLLDYCFIFLADTNSSISSGTQSIVQRFLRRIFSSGQQAQVRPQILPGGRKQLAPIVAPARYRG